MRILKKARKKVNDDDDDDRAKDDETSISLFNRPKTMIITVFIISILKIAFYFQTKSLNWFENNFNAKIILTALNEGNCETFR